MQPRLRGVPTLAFTALLVALAVLPLPAQAEPVVFNPTLSLTGSCKTSEADPVADPNCPEGPLPAVGFSNPKSVTTDSYGNIFVASYGQAEGGGEGRVDIFDPSGHFVYEKEFPNGVRNIAVDKSGNLYLVDQKNEILRYHPTFYEPAVPKIEYGSPTAVVEKANFNVITGLAVDPATQHIFAHFGLSLTEYGSATEESKVIDATIGKGTLENALGPGLAIDRTRKRIYASDREPPEPGKPFGSGPPVVRVFNLEPPYELLETINGSTTPEGKFLSDFFSLAVDEGSGNLFVYDGEGSKTIYELTENGGYLSTIDHEFRYTYGTEIAVDNGEKSPNGALNSFGRYLYVPSYPTGTGHTFAFGPSETAKPEIKSASVTGVTDSESKLVASIKPNNLDTSYIFEYTTQLRYEEEGESFVGAQVAGTGEIPAGGAPVEVAAALEGLTPGTAYHFRVIATNEKGSDEAKRPFSTYPEEEAGPICENQALRIGFSALLPDCRAYELVTPPDTNARAPLGVGRLGTYFATREASPSGDDVSYEIKGGSIPGFEATGSYAGDPYLASRGKEGWQTSYVGPTGAESPASLPGSNSPDQGYSFWSTGSSGTASIGGPTTYVRYPDGSSHLVGRGGLGTDPRAVGRLISEGGSHIVFTSGGNAPAVQLEPNAPPDGTSTVYDRTIDQETGEEETHVVSLLPGDVTPAEGEGSVYQGASLDGRGIAFSIGKTLYLRYNDEETYEIGENVTFSGVAEGGKRIFYVQGGNLYAYEAEGEENPISFSSSKDVTPVNVSADGTVAYFVSPSVLAGEANPNGADPVKGEENLYRSEEGSITFVGTVTDRDVEGEFASVETVDGLGLWTEAVGILGGATPGRLGIDPSRSTPDGGVLLFESRAPLTGYDSEKHAEIYRYDFVSDELKCLSCNPTNTQAAGNASLQSIRVQQGLEPSGPYAYVPNLRADGGRAFFQSPEPLVLRDTDNLQDVYEWEEEGVGSCKRPEGCIYLISSGNSHYADYLYGISDSGNDVFFASSDLLLPSDLDETPSIYDARVEGGFAEISEEECLGEGCRPGLSLPPALPTIASKGIGPPGNPESPVHCRKGQRKVIHNGRTRCVKKHHQRKQHRAGSKRKGAGK